MNAPQNRTRQRLLLAASCSLTLLAPLACQAKSEGAPTLGFAKVKPTDGPSVETAGRYMVAYTEQIPGTDVTFEMIPIPGGEFLLGSPADEAGRNDDEGPQVKVKVAPCWVGKCEVTWAEYRAYMNTYAGMKSMNSMRVEMKRFGAESEKLKPLPVVTNYLKQEQLDIDGVTSPTPLYYPDVTYAYGDHPDQPAVSMSQFAARQYTKWVSGITTREYRLPTEAEWEYAARAGSTSGYSFEDDESIDEYAWYAENSNDELNVVGSKRPNAWGLHDMHGNVAEMVLDQYDDAHYGSLTGTPTALEAVRWPTELFPRSIRGGCWYDEPDALRSAARRQTDSEWKEEDPNLPKSPWWFTEDPTSGVGFRILRPLAPMDDELKKKVWDVDNEEIRLDVAGRLQEGRGTRSSADPRLPAALEELESAGLVE